MNGLGSRAGRCWLLLPLLLAATLPARADSVVVFNEIMYHPATNAPGQQWVELHNQMAVDVDLSGWTIGGGVKFKFMEGTVIPGGGYLVVAGAPADLRAATGLTNILGPVEGQLSDSGDILELRNNNQRLMDRVSFGVEGDWPVGPNGSGASLAKQDEDSASSQARSWTVSALVGGTPGRRNFAQHPFEAVTTTPVALDGLWKYDGSDSFLDGAWRQVAYDDSAWASGHALFRAGDLEPPPGEMESVTTAFSTGLDAAGNALPPGSADPHYLLTKSAQATPAPPPVPATVIQNHPAWAANDAESSWIGVINPGTANVAAGAYSYRTSFSLAGFDPASAVVTLRVGADNRLNDVLLNGVSKGISYLGFATLSGPFTVTNGFVPGTNTLDFLTFNDTTSPNPAGFRAQLAGLARKRLQAQTTLSTAPLTGYLRSKFLFAGEPALAALRLQAFAAHGAVFYLNGVEVLRINMAAGPISASTPALSDVLKPTSLGPYPLPTTALLRGTNVLSVELHQGPGKTGTLLFGAQLSLTLTNILVPPAVNLAFNEFSSATSSNFWLELLNYGSTDLDLSGCVLERQRGSQKREYVIPPQTLAPGALLQLTKMALGFGADPGDRFFLYSPDRLRVVDALVAKRDARGRRPDGTGRWCYPTELTPGASNRFVFHDEIVINEIMYHAPAASATNAITTPEELWLELYNRSDHPVDLTGWRLARDTDYLFPAGTAIPSEGYLVVAKDPDDMRRRYPAIVCVGPFQNKLHHKGGDLLLLDSTGNPANEVSYLAGRPWPEYAAGGGSSLELRDPWADNSKPEAWAASSEARRSGWNTYAYRAIARNALGPTLWKEFVIGLLEAGECLVDDLKVVESPSGTPVSLLQNGDFESGLAAWRLLGNHSHSFVESDPDDPTNHVLHLVATGPTDHLHNHLETTLAGGRAVVDGREYQVSHRAKWLAGNNHLNTRLYFNRVARTTTLPLPSEHGTPGARNSTFVANLGPTFDGFEHSPIVPKPNEPVTVSLNASDPQGIRAVTLWWSVNGGGWNQMPMLPGIQSAAPGYQNFAAVLNGQPSGTLVQFYAQAIDGLGAMTTYPASGPASRALFKVDDGKARRPSLHSLRLLMTPADVALLHAHTNVMSNARIGLTLVYDERQVFYDVGVHLQSSERGRDDSSRVGFTVKLQDGQLFRGLQNNLTIDRSGGYSGLGGRQDEILLWHAVNHAGGIPGIYCDLVQVFAPRPQEDSTGLLRMSAFDGDYFDSQYAQGSEGNIYKLEIIYYPTTTSNGQAQAPKLPQPDQVINVDFQNSGDDPENYRWVFLQENHADQDDYRQVITLNKAFSLSGAALEAQTGQLMDVDEWMRALAFKAFTGDADTFTYGLNHNWKVFFSPEDGRAIGLLWDMDFSFAQSVNYAFPGSGSPATLRITRLPNNYRRFYNHLYDLMTTTVNANYLRPWAKHYAGLVGQDWSGAVNYLQQRATFIRSTMPLTTPFAITSGGGKDFGTTNDPLILAGSAPLSVKGIAVNGIQYPINWTSLTNWNVTVPLPDYLNVLIVRGVDNYGHFLTNATDFITITNLAANLPAPRISAVSIGPDGTFTFAVAVVPGRTYRVEYKDELNDPRWSALGDDRSAVGTELSVSEPLNVGRQRFYHILLLP